MGLASVLVMYSYNLLSAVTRTAFGCYTEHYQRSQEEVAAPRARHVKQELT
jgi:hypothetical protein